MFNFCSTCGTRTVRKIPQYDDVERAVCPACDAIFYDSPTVLIGCTLFCGRKMLWMKRAHPPRDGYWMTPIGYVERRETLEEATIREIREEVGIQLEPRQLSLLGVATLIRMNQIYIGFYCEIDEEIGTPGQEALDIAWCAEEEAPWDELAFADAEPFFRALYAWLRQDRPAGGLDTLPFILKEGIIDSQRYGPFPGRPQVK